MPGTILSTGDTAVNKMKALFHRTYIIKRKQTNKYRMQNRNRNKAGEEDRMQWVGRRRDVVLTGKVRERVSDEDRFQQRPEGRVGTTAIWAECSRQTEEQVKPLREYIWPTGGTERPIQWEQKCGRVMGWGNIREVEIGHNTQALKTLVMDWIFISGKIISHEKKSDII